MSFKIFLSGKPFLTERAHELWISFVEALMSSEKGQAGERIVANVAA
jgi:hypothetical protein